jgi:hypothetical protein
LIEWPYWAWSTGSFPLVAGCRQAEVGRDQNPWGSSLISIVKSALTQRSEILHKGGEVFKNFRVASILLTISRRAKKCSKLDIAKERNKNMVFLIIGGIYKILISCYAIVGSTNAQGLVALITFGGSLGNKLA